MRTFEELDLLFAFLFIACQKPSAPMEPKADIPALAAPVAEMYAVGKSQPKDQLVQKAVVNLPWDEALSGAASSLGLNNWPTPRMSDAKWAAIVSGYPYEVLRIVSGSVAVSDFPKGLSEQLSSMVKPGQHVGLARIRRGSEDVWIGIVGAGGPSLTAFPKEMSLGLQLKIESSDSQWRALAPNGDIYQGKDPLKLALDQPGIWWLELSDKSGIYMSVPIFIDRNTPPTNWFPDPYAFAAPDVVKSETLAAINEIRNQNDLPQFSIEDALETLSVHPLEKLKQNVWDRQTGESRLIDAGYGGGPVAQLACKGSELGACLDEIAWSLDGRAAILNPNLRRIGIGAYVETNGLAVIINLASE